MEARIEVKYFYVTETGEFKAEITAFLPKKEGDTPLHPILRNKNVMFFGEHLSKYWGTRIDEHRVAYTYVKSDESWEDLKEKVRKKIEEEIEKLKEVKRENERRMEKTPKDETFVYEI